MKRILTLVIAAAVATSMAAPLRAEMAQQPPTTEMTRSEWNKLQAGYKKDKAKYAACNAKAKAEKLRGRKRWAAIQQCMTSG